MKLKFKPFNNKPHIRDSLGIAFLYLLIGSLWILLSDKMLLEFFSGLSAKQLTYLQTYKGWFYVITTSILLFVTVKFYLNSVYEGKKKLIESEKKYRHLFEVNPTPIWVCSKSTLKITAANNAFIKKYGYYPEEVESLSLFSLFIENDKRKIKLLLDDKKPDFSGIWTQVEKNGNHIFIELYAHHIDYDNEDAFLFLAFDITSRILIEKEIQLLNKELEKRVEERTIELQGTIEELKTFTYSVSHDLRAPLRAINNFTANLIEHNQSQLDQKSKNQLDIVLKNSVEMDKLIEALLNLSNVSRQVINASKIPMNLLVDSIIQNICIDLKCKNENFHYDKLNDLFGDPSLIKIVMTNLLSNAIKFTSKKEKPLIKIASEISGDFIIYSVSDNGVGFDKQYSNKLFNVFQRLHSKDDFEGTGIGLAIVKRIISKHGGKVWAESENDSGAKFYFSIPQLNKSRQKK